MADSGEKYWGRFGAAGLLALDPQRGVLLQHRVQWSHYGGTWGLPGGALHEGESALDGAVREAQEEAGIPDGVLSPRFARVLDLKIWSYTTVVADVAEPFEPIISDPESLALEWVPVDEVDQRPLHPGFAAAWPALRSLLDVRPAIVIDAAMHLGSRVSAWAATGVPAARLGLDADTWYPAVSTAGEAVEGEAVVAEALRLLDAGSAVTAVTSDPELRSRLEQVGAVVHGASWLQDQLVG